MPDARGPLFSQPVDVMHVGRDGTSIVIRPDEANRHALANALDLPSIAMLEGRFRLASAGGGHVSVTGTVVAAIEQTCVLTLDPFPVSIEETVDVDFAPASGVPPVDETDPPDEIVDGRIDLGALTAELLAMALDPFPRKPGAVFDYKDPADVEENPFAALASLKPK